MQDLSVLYSAMLNYDAEVFQEETAKQLRAMISYMDSNESFCHGFMLGLMANLSEYMSNSNRESGSGRYDVCIYSNDVRLPVIILEFKVAGRFGGT